MGKKILKRLISLVIWFRYKYNFETVYKYEVGEYVKYNWKAKIYIDTAIKDNVNDTLTILEIKHRRNEFIYYQNTRTKETGWCDAYWLTKRRLSRSL